MSAAEAAALELKNATQIAVKLDEARALPASDVTGNLRVYDELVRLAPNNMKYLEKRGHYERMLAEQKRYADDPELALELVNFTWQKGGFDNVQLVRFSVRNKAPFPIKDFELTCVHQGPSGTDMDRNVRTVYELVPANGSKYVREVNMGFIAAQATSSRCDITDAVRA